MTGQYPDADVVPRSGSGGTIHIDTPHAKGLSGDTADGRLPRSVRTEDGWRTSPEPDAGSTPARGHVGYGTCVGSWEKLPCNIIPWVGDKDRPLIILSGQPSIGVAYNVILDAYRGKGMDAVVLLHDDLEITDPNAEKKFLAALDEDVALVGVAGGGPALRWWDHHPIGHQMTDSGLLDFGQRTGDVDMLEGSIVVFSPWAVENLSIDERYTDFRSGWDDVCLHARAAGKRVVVVDVDTHHHTTVGWKTPQIEAKFIESERMFAEKWAAA